MGTPRTFACSLLVIFLLGTISLSSSSAIPDAFDLTNFNTLSIVRDYWPTEEWIVDSPENHGMDSGILAEVERTIDHNGYAIDSVVVVREGYIVYEYYGEEWDGNDMHMIHSCTKCITSTLVGIAIDQGLIESIDSKMMDFFSNWTIQNVDERKMNITIEHLLTWTDGMEFHEIDYPYNDPRNDLGQMWVSDDALQYCLDRPMWKDPGESWWMNSGTLIILGGIIEIQSGMSVFEYAHQYLFEPLGIDQVYWSQIGGGAAGGWYHTDGGLHLTAHDFAKFGYLMLNNGTWDGDQIVSEEWVSEATVPRFTTGWSGSYELMGYQWWWWPDQEIYSAHGHYEQALYVSQEHDLVVVFNGNVPDGENYPADALIRNWIIPSIEGEPFPPPSLEDVLSGTVVIGFAAVIVIFVVRRKWFSTNSDAV